MNNAVDISHDQTSVSSSSSKRLSERAREFLEMEASGGIILVIAAMAAIILANTSFFNIYDHLLNNVQFRIGFDDLKGTFDLELKKSTLLWINDGFMAIFFFLVGLEIKREVAEGGLSDFSRALLPALGALGGIVVPAIIYWFINKDVPGNLDGWAIPVATDIAFALGVLGLLGSRVPTSLKVLLTAIAVIDDIGAILIIAFFYSHGLVLEPLYFAAGALAVLFVMNRRGVSATSPYVIVGIILWIAVLKSGVHATLAGVVTALFVPMQCPKDERYSPVKHLEHTLHPWVAFAILPIFAFANAGVPFTGMGLHSLADPVTLGIIIGLVVGKPVGIFSVVYMTVKSGFSPMPKNATWPQIFAVSILCGIGFTMSLFIGGLAFESQALQASIRLGVLTASLVAAVGGYLVFYIFSTPHGPAVKQPHDEETDGDVLLESEQQAIDDQADNHDPAGL